MAVVFKMSVQRAIAYRVDFLFQSLSAVIGLAGGLGAVIFVFSQVQTLAGWTLPQTILLLGAFTLVSRVVETFISPNLDWFATRVLNGELDSTLLQPLPSILLATLGVAQPWGLAQVLLGSGVIAVGLVATKAQFTIAGCLAGLGLLLVGVGTMWAYRVILASLAFWAPGLETGVLFSGVWQTARYPLAVYSKPVQWTLLYVFPVGAVITVPVRIVSQGPDLSMVLYALVACAASISLALLFWSMGLRKYTSATS
jgi:ABC-2 type transport system permease protein